MIKSLAEVRASTSAALSMSEVATVLDLDPRTISAAAAAGEIPSVRIGRRVLVPREAFLAMLDNQAVGSAR
ncbi:excisionase family DNA binding protein [Marisediminicola sp. UYEF4]|uniref:helix-turn-helix domain-containing protein n=1 Tax=Marisediminicola sp. UYEF4 TaxID=1756384 RepID=UPI0033969C0C